MMMLIPHELFIDYNYIFIYTFIYQLRKETTTMKYIPNETYAEYKKRTGKSLSEYLNEYAAHYPQNEEV